jgi:abhydrolase domain-containing protein 17
VTRVLLTLAACYAIIVAIAWLVSDRMIFLPPAASYDERSLAVTSVATEDGSAVAVRYLPNPDARHTLLFSHGNAEDLGYLEPFLQALWASGFAVLAYDYRGYGLSSEHTPTVAGAYHDEAAVFRHATQVLGIPAERIILHGRSVGSGPAVALATRERVAGLVIESGFVSAYRVMTRWPLLPFDKFPNLARLPSVLCPVLVIHGRQDWIIPFWHGEKLYAAAPNPKQSYWVEQAGHNDLTEVAGQEYFSRLQAFARSLEPPQ